MTTTRFDFTAGEHQLAGMLDLPDDDPPRAFALFAHCFTCSKNLRASTTVSRQLARHGYGVLRFDFTGLGASEGAFEDTTFSSNVSDLVAAAQALGREYEAPRLLVGHSLGGAAVLRAAEQIDSVTAVATLGAPCDPEHVARLIETAREEIEQLGYAEVTLAGRTFRIRREFLDDLAAHPMRDAIGRLGRALMVLHSPIDEVVGIENASRIFKAARHPKSFVSLDDADHLLTRQRDAEFAAGVIAAWGERYLPPAEPQPPLQRQEGVRVRGPTKGGFRTEMDVAGHPLVGDEPPSVGGTDTGPTPYGFVLAGLGACTAMTLRMYADRKGIPLERADIELDHAKVHASDCAECDEAAGTRIDRIRRRITLHGDLDDAQRQRLLQIADRCPVHRTLESKVWITSELV